MSALPQSYTPGQQAFEPASVPDRARTEVPRLRLVRAPQHARTRVPFVLFCIAILLAALLGALVLNTSMARGAYVAHDLQISLAQEARTEQELSSQLLAHMAPGALAASARELGMVPAPELAFLRLSDGAVLGSPTPAGAGG
ncbi:hypothetical protein [Pengzhenrongella frigida]|uniref:Cell division protein FtsL n=1 Tax=Pengzhenrongella frigida TaxID=1259133 RepID=A0A4Q5N2R3_9MICO|nr:hypothetical protein [Cellulomonas sp. HLT2-17]RYV52482.1 hypothetical protein EUA98_03205 [Cellulomonas sp. HLT2-17]